MKRNRIIIGLLVLAAVLALVRVLTLGSGTDKEQILTALDESIKAGREGRPGSVVEHLANSIKVNDDVYSNYSRDVGKFIKQSKPDVTVFRREPVINGDTAEITSPVRLQAQLLSYTVDRTLPNVTIIFKKERGTKWLIIPATSWKIAGVRAPEISPTDFLSQ